MTQTADYQHILVAIDFSLHSEAALKQAIWLGRKTGAKIVVTHVLPDLRKALLAASSNAQLDIFVGDGDQFQREIRSSSDARMQALIKSFAAEDLGIRCETLLGDPSIAIIHAVQQEKHDLVLVGTRGQSMWEKLFIGSTAKRLIRKCPCAVWTVKAEHVAAPTKVMVATDFSEASRDAANVALGIARISGAEMHLLHVIDSKDVPDNVIDLVSPGSTLREHVNAAATARLEAFVTSLGSTDVPIVSHLSWGIPSQEVARMAEHLKIELLVLGTVGRSGVKGVLLGNTAERVLDTCHCSTLTIKPQGYVSPIDPPFWPLHPDSEMKTD